MNKASRIGLGAFSVFLLSSAILYQWLVRDLIYITYGRGRMIQPVSEFPYKCRRIEDDRNIQACEDMWLDPKSRTLFLPCSDSLSRPQWLPNPPMHGLMPERTLTPRDAYSVHHFNVSGRGLDDRVLAMRIDEPTSSGGFAYKLLKPIDYSGVAGDERIHVIGITGTTYGPGSGILLYLVNARPSVDAETGEILDPHVAGANSTIDVFSIHKGADTMKHIKTFAGAQIATPNNVALARDGGFYFTNDHGPHKVGWRSHYSPLLNTGDVSYCSASGKCRRVAAGFRFPNGLHFASDGLLYVPGAATGRITVFKPLSDGSLLKVHRIPLEYPIDNLSEDSNGDIFAASIPDVKKAKAAFHEPLSKVAAPATVWRVKRLNKHKPRTYEYELSKIIEDREGEVLPGMTTVVHDAVTGRLFMSGVVSPYITVCEPV